MSKKDVLKSPGAKRMAFFAVMCILSVICMATIFTFSSQTSEESAPHSNTVTDTVVKVIDSDHEKPEKYNAEDLYYRVEKAVRKAGHFAIYALLGVLTYFAAASTGIFSKNCLTPSYISVPLCVVYAISDEVHQLLVDGRHGRISDVLIDGAGIVIGTLIAVRIAGALAKKSAGKRGVKK